MYRIDFLLNEYLKKVDVQDLKRDLGLVFELCKSVRLYQGRVTILPADLVWDTVEKNRSTKQFPQSFQRWLDLGFKAVFGEPVRSQCIFGVRDFQKARWYGSGDRDSASVIFPVPPFRFYYSNEIENLWYEDWATKIAGSNLPEEVLAGVAFVVFSCDKKIKNTKQGTRAFLKETLLTSAHWDLNDKDVLPLLVQKYPNAAEAFVKHFYKRSSNWKDLLKVPSHTEVMVVCDKYYLATKRLVDADFDTDKFNYLH